MRRPFLLPALAAKAMKYSFVFICQQGELEIKSLLLAASLKRFLRCDHELVAALPQPESRWGKPADATLHLLASLEVRQALITNPVDEGYPIGNKLACLSIETTADKIFFLDSDILCLREFSHLFRFEQAFNAKPADLRTFGSEPGEWGRVYAALGLDLPTVPVLATVGNQSMPPYFNAGMVAVRRDAGLGEVWADCARAIDANPAIGNKRPWLDQITLPVAVARLGLEVDCLDERFNYPAHLKPLDRQNLPYFCHYHSPDMLRREPLANALVVELVSEYPALRPLIEVLPEWRILLEPYTLKRTTHLPFLRPSREADMRKAAEASDVVITGIPRSGTSYLCSILNRVSDCVVINEPAQIFPPLAGQMLPWGVPTLYRDLRRNILDGEPIENKLHNGEFIEDTAQVDVVETYLPVVSRPDFLLATKNTLAYLARLSELRRVMPSATMIVCVRNPLDTIASWKNSFDHLAQADVENFPVGNPQDSFFSIQARQRLEEISFTRNPAMRRALLWRHLAELILENRDRVLLLRYEEMVVQPAAVLQQILFASSSKLKLRFNAPVAPSTVRTRRGGLDKEDLQAIRRLCGQSAVALGYGEM